MTYYLDKKRFPEKVFREDLKYFTFTYFDALFDTSLYRALSLVEEKGEKGTANFNVVSPDPFAFNNSMFGNGAFTLNLEDTKSVLNCLEYGGDESIEVLCYEVAIESNSLLWSLYSDREFEIAAVGFKAIEDLLKFEKNFNRENILGVQQVKSLFNDIFGEKSIGDLFEKNWAIKVVDTQCAELNR